jgi:hypothetical protein
MDLRELGRKEVDLIRLTQNMFQWCSLAIPAMKLRVHKRWEILDHLSYE